MLKFPIFNINLSIEMFIKKPYLFGNCTSILLLKIFSISYSAIVTLQSLIPIDRKSVV